MAVAIPSDLVLDVMRNATPFRTGRVGGLAAAAGDTCAVPKPIFSGILNGLSPMTEPKDDLIAGVLDAGESGRTANSLERLGGKLEAAGEGSAGSAHTSPQVAFEQMVLRNMFEAMLPGADSGIYGEEGSSSGVWRSLFADNLATAYAKAGGLGIAASLVKHPGADGPVSHGQWPYFEQQTLDGLAG